jgi:hypothetical protein
MAAYKTRFAPVVAASVAMGSLVSAQPCSEAWDESLAPLGSNGGVNAFLESDFDGGAHLYAAGVFTQMDGVSANRIAGWDGLHWSALSTGFNNIAFALEEFDDGGGRDLYAGGTFTEAGGFAALCLARWDGAQWSAVGGGITGLATPVVRALATFDDGSGESLFVGGDFDDAGGVATSNIARWDGSQFHAVGAGLNGTVFALGVHDDGGGPALYAAGEFTQTADGAASMSRIAKWDGASWTAVGDGFNSTVFALASGTVGGVSRLHAAGDFSASGEDPISCVAEWDGIAWTPLAGGIQASGLSLEVIDGSLYAGGTYAFADGLPANGVARWDGSQWSTLATGLTGVARCDAIGAMSLTGDGIAIGGFFTGAGNATVDNIAHWTPCEVSAPGDLSGDGNVDGADLAILLAAWGGGGPADIDGSGVVDGADLAALLSAWAF